jgi:hypothetical protein
MVVQLLAPVEVQGFEQLVAQAVYSRSFEVSVNEPFNWTVVWIAVGAVGGFLAGLAAILRLMRRRHLVVGKEQEQTPEGKETKPKGG